MLGYGSFQFRYPVAVAVHHAGAAPVAASITSCIEAPRRVSSLASPTWPDWPV